MLFQIEKTNAFKSWRFQFFGKLTILKVTALSFSKSKYPQKVTLTAFRELTLLTIIGVFF